MEITKDDFVNWQYNIVTQAVFSVIREQIQQTKDMLAVRAGSDPLFDKTMVGLIQGYNNILEIQYDEISSDNVSDSTPSSD